MENNFHSILRKKLDGFVHSTYRVTKQFPKNEVYGATSQLRRASLSVMLNYVEGFARKRKLVKVNFLEIAYGSLQETKYLLEFARDEQWISPQDWQALDSMAQEIGAMLWTTVEHLSRDT